MSAASFDPEAYKRTTTDQWQAPDQHAAFVGMRRDGFEGPCELLVAAGAAPA